MNRSKLNKLMSRASTLALAAVGGVVATGGAQAAGIDNTTYPGTPLNQVLVSNNTDFITLSGKSIFSATPGDITTNSISILGNVSVLNAGAGDEGISLDNVTLEGGFSNAGIVVGDDETGLAITDSWVRGKIYNSGQITSATDDGIFIAQTRVDGGLTNAGSINAGGRGIWLDNDDLAVPNNALTFQGGIVNTSAGEIDSGSTGIFLDGVDTLNFRGGISNSGNIFAGKSAIRVNGGVDFEGGIHNFALAEISSDNAAGIWISVDGEFDGGIHNAGTIIGHQTTGTGGAHGIRVDGSVNDFRGGITNSGLISTGASVSGPGQSNAIQIEAETFGDSLAPSVGILNQLGGRLVAIDDGISFDNIVTDVFGGVTNAGSINAGETGIYVSVDTFQGGITNTGTGEITGVTNGIHLANGTFNGGITQLQYGEIFSSGDGIRVDSVVVFSNAIDNDGIANAGLIDANDDGINVEALTFFGGVVNTGSIDAGDVGIRIGDGGEEAFRGGVTNAGTITAVDTGIEVSVETFDLGIRNDVGASIIANQGIDVNVSATFAGGVSNAGLVRALTGDAINIDPQTFTGGITNSGQLIAVDGTGIYLEAADISGKIINTTTGVITTTNGSGIRIDDGLYPNVLLRNGVENAGRITTTGDNAIEIVVDDFDGGFVNSTSGTNVGYIQSVSGGSGVLIEADTFDGGFNNAGRILAGSNGADAVHLRINVFGGVSGGITNSGTIDGGDDGLRIESLTGAGVFNNGIQNLVGAQILAGETGIEVDLATFNGVVTNAGLIQSATDDAVNFDVTDFNGNFINSGTIISNGEDGIGIDFSDTFNGNITNSGTIAATDTGIELSGDTFEGNVVNEKLIHLADTGVDLSMTNFTGNFTNTATGQILATGTGVHFNNVFLGLQTFDGEFSNAGNITGTQHGVFVEGVDTFGGSITNSGTSSRITSTTNYALYLSDVGTFEGGITNAGTIESLHSTSLYIENTTIGGRITNSGLIRSSGAGDDAIDIDGGHVTEGIFNSGTIQASDDALELSDTDLDITFTQTTGAVIGDIRMDQQLTEYNDTLNFNGGTMLGDIDGSTSGDVMNVTAGSGSFAYLGGEIEGLDQFNVESGTAIMGSTAVGTQGNGVDTVGADIDFINVNGGALYLDDDTDLDANVAFDQEADGEVQFLLSLDAGNEKSGHITGGTVAVDGKVTGVIDLAAFAASGGLMGPFVYNDVFDAGAGADLTYTVAPTDLSILNDLIFFTIEDDVDPDGTVDLIVNRLSFSEVLADASQSSNQQAVGDVLEQLFNSGTTDPDFEDAFEDLLGSSSYDEALAVYDQLLGAEHAQAALGMFNSMSQFQGFLGERMDVLHNGMGSAQWAMFGQPGTQVAAAETVLADASPSPAMGGSSMVTPRNGNTISMFGGVSGNWASVEGDTNGPGFDQDTVALNAGVDYAFSSETVVGLGGSYQTSELEFESANSGDVDTVAVGLFGTFGLGGGYLDTNANVGFHDVSSSRLTPALDYASAEYSATSWSVAGELGSVIPVGRAYVAPMLSMTYVGVSVDGFTETGSALALTVDSADTNSFATVLGARAGNYFKVGKATVNLQGNLGWRHEFGDEESSFTAAFIEDPALLFNVDSSKIASDSATFGLGTTVSVSTRLEVFVNYDGAWNAEADSHNASLGVRSTW